jgi:hypothetical protein
MICRMTRAPLATALLLTTLGSASLASPAFAEDPRLAGASRSESNGWIVVRLQGPPAQLGFQHGRLLAQEIEDALAVARLGLTHGSDHDWEWYRKAAREVLWPRIEDEYRQELRGIADGLAAGGVKADVWDLLTLNASTELGYYEQTLAPRSASKAPERCSAFVATGSWTTDGRPVIAHNNWTGYADGARWNVIFDLRPTRGHRVLMDGMAGLVHSGDDFGINSAGLAITETTIERFKGFDPKGVAEFARARKAMQYAGSIDEFDRLMREGNNGGYANAWLVADMNTGEIARLELGLKNVTLERTKDGAFTGANFPVHPKLVVEETDFDPNDASLSANARRVRWDQLMAEHKGRIDTAAARRFLADHHDAFLKKDDAPSERTLCGHIDLSPRGSLPWATPFAPKGTVQSKVADAASVRRMSLEAAMGHPCGTDFGAAAHLAQHPEFAWQKDLLRDLPSRPWTAFAAE